MTVPTAIIETIAHALRNHRRTLSPTGHGVRCECGRHYPDTHAWHRHLAELTMEATTP